MKKIIFLFLALILIIGCNRPKEIKTLTVLPIENFTKEELEKEEEAIKEAIKKEFDLFWERNTDAESDFWVKENYMTSLNIGENSLIHRCGWDSIYANIKRGSEHENWQYVSNLKTELTDFQIKIYDKVAWAVYYGHNTWDFKGEPYDDGSWVRVTFLEKVGNKWKIALNCTSGINPCEKEEYRVQKQY